MKKLFTLTIICFSLFAKAQDYDFTKDIKAYDYLSEATLVNSNFSTLDSIEIPFSFKFYDKVVSKIYVQNANFGFNGNMINGSPFQVNLSKNDSGGIYYLIEGEPGEQILKIDWRNALLKDAEIAGSDSINFQVWLYEFSNEIEFHYGISNIDSGTYDKIIGRCFIQSLDKNKSLLLHSSPSNPTIIKNDTNTILGLDTFPLSAYVYQFSPISQTTNVVKNEQDKNATVFPNPFNETITITSESPIKTLKIYNLEGKCLISETDNKINTKHLASGVYMLYVISDENVIYKKIIKE